MEKEKYVAYVSTYTSGNKSSFGIKIYDVDLEAGRLYEKDQVEITNSSYVTISHNEKYLYSITDFGVESYKILKDGGLSVINHASINGMRGCYLSTDYEDKFLFVAGYHDAKVTVLRVREDGSIGEITDEIFHKGLGSIAERTFRPHINCVKMTRDNKFLCAADLGMDHVIVYELNHLNGRLRQVDIIRSELESAPRHLKFSRDGKIVYIVHELKNYIDVYRYSIDEHGIPVFDKIQNISTLNTYHAGGSAASALNLSEDFKYLCSSNAGDNSVVLYSIDQKTGLLSKILCLPISGDYPKDAALFPDNKHLVSLNHETNTMTFFNVDMEKKTIVMNGKAIPVAQPNCIIFYKLRS
ncbi:lactonase family protein [Parablautia intestinalis]|uniref:Lactonase family protein n=1 Tax=Parablautia intestinalis TaxID=2320100 RepID=A0A3A9AEF7_9FIRM|nr:beta-propeller fold lactonase family protein [Parablautia intestinalis]RKI90050.1 lactonase family protein [Parablautia intestinalis]